jgi:hypothetical protein
MKWRVKDWRKFQHFRDRRPPWIKLYRDLLDDPDWHDLKPDAAKALVMLWLIASEDDGNLPDPRKLAFRMRMNEKQVNQLLNSLTHWLEQVDIGVISPGYLDDAPERETYREETETEAPEAPTVRDELLRVLDSERAEGVIEHRKRLRKPLSVRAAKLLAAELAKAPDPNLAADTLVARGWAGFDVDWLKNKNGHDPPPTITNAPPAGFREAGSTSEYVAYMREKTGDPKLENGDWRLSKWQWVPKDWSPNVVQIKRAG